MFIRKYKGKRFQYTIIAFVNSKMAHIPRDNYKVIGHLFPADKSGRRIVLEINIFFKYRDCLKILRIVNIKIW